MSKDVEGTFCSLRVIGNEVLSFVLSYCQTVLAFWLGMAFESFSSNVLVATSQAVGMLGSLCWGGLPCIKRCCTQ